MIIAKFNSELPKSEMSEADRLSHSAIAKSIGIFNRRRRKAQSPSEVCTALNVGDLSMVAACMFQSIMARYVSSSESSDDGIPSRNASRRLGICANKNAVQASIAHKKYRGGILMTKRNFISFVPKSLYQ